MSKMSKKLFATDFDGTLCLYPHGVQKEVIEKIDRFRSEGNIFGVITGRNIDNLASIWETVGSHIDFLMPMTGSVALDGKGEVIFEYEGDGKVLIPLFREIIALDGKYLCWADGKSSFNVDIDTSFDENHPDYIEAQKHIKFSQVNTMFASEDEAFLATEKLVSLFGDKINPQINGQCVDIPPAGVSKGAAVLRMAQLFGVNEDCIFTAGDNRNDVSMLEMHYGFSLPWARPEAQAAAREIYNNVGEMLQSVMK